MANKYSKTFQPRNVLSPVTNPPEVGIPDRNPGVKTGGRFVPHGGTAKEVPKYTGDEMIGIGLRHKSGLEPVFSKEQAEALAHMRR